jgi:hypothetical protein
MQHIFWRGEFVMNRSRIAFAVIALAAIFFLSLSPAAQALPQRGKPSISESGGWLDMAVAWMGRLLSGPGNTTGVEMQKGGKEVIAYTGSCIDPDGYKVPCPR